MKIIFGLGNPGEQYFGTRHNIGFEILDFIQKEWDFSPFEFNKKLDALVSKGTLSPTPSPSQGEGGQRPSEGQEREILLAKPQTFVNLSGEAVQKILEFYKLIPNDIIVIHDDLDIALGKYKVATDSSSAGHNGVQNIIDKLGTQKFKRVRIGINPDVGNANLRSEIIAEKFVLQKFSEEERKKIADLEPVILEEIKKLL
jgi:PTH1 family peptidyl-tRNA hydrolase